MALCNYIYVIFDSTREIGRLEFLGPNKWEIVEKDE